MMVSSPVAARLRGNSRPLSGMLLGRCCCFAPAAGSGVRLQGLVAFRPDVEARCFTIGHPRNNQPTNKRRLAPANFDVTNDRSGRRPKSSYGKREDLSVFCAAIPVLMLYAGGGSRTHTPCSGRGF